jgi:phosphatidylglycerol:prolipoprotein diacylglycerol transferase
MHPYLFHNVSFPTYGVCILVGIALAWLLARSLARRGGVEPSDVDLLVPIVTSAGLAGACMFGWLTHWVVGSNTSHGPGTVLFGSLLLATAAGIAYAVARKIPLGVLGDVLAAPIALGIACGRVGCFAAGCCFGKTAHWGVAFPAYSFAWEHQRHAGTIDASAATSLAVHPVQWYEAALMLMLAIVLVKAFRRRQVSGELFLLLGLAYAALRFALEFLRADNPPAALGMTFSQLVALLVLAACGATLALRRRAVDRLHLRITTTMA